MLRNPMVRYRAHKSSPVLRIKPREPILPPPIPFFKDQF